MAKKIYIDNPDPAGPDIDPETNTIDVGGGMFGSRMYLPPPPDNEKDDGNRRRLMQHPSLRGGSTGYGPSLTDPTLNRWFDTPLTPSEQSGYRAWEQKNVPQPPSPNYDMQGYYKDIVEKGQNKTAINPIDHRVHFPDTYKKPSYPTFSEESKYATGPFRQMAGRWSGEQFIPPGVPTAGQEALQDPRIDPTFVAAGGIVGGPMAAIGNALAQALSPHVGKVTGLPVGGGPLTRDINEHLMKLTDYGQQKLGSAGRPPLPGVVDRFGRPIFDESGKMIPWSESEKAILPKQGPKIEWTKVSDMLKKLMGDIGEIE